MKHLTMNRKILSILTIVLLASCGSSKNNAKTGADNALSKAEQEQGFQMIFDGKTTRGWHTYGRNTAGKAWRIDNGALHLDKSGNLAKGEGGDIVTDDEYENFHLKLDWKISEKGNSGIIFPVKEDPQVYGATYQTGLEYQVLDNGTPTRAGHSDAKIYTHRAGDLYDLLASEEAVNPLGEWNHTEIKLLNGKLDFYMNGKHTLSTTLWNDNWNQMVALSKFKDMAGFGKFRKGKIALQDHGDAVWYKNIRIKRL